MIFGTYELPASVQAPDISVDFVVEASGVNYRRECLGEIKQKRLISEPGSVVINPVEPTNLPKKITTNILIEFDQPLLVKPESQQDLFVTFPVEIGVFVGVDKRPRTIDIFSLQPKKLTLYGEPSNGVICHYWQSPVFLEKPELDQLRLGLVELSLTNGASGWIELTKAVFDTNSMKIMFGDNSVRTCARLKIKEDGTAETTFDDMKDSMNQTRSIEVNIGSKLKINTTKFLMENGL